MATRKTTTVVEDAAPDDDATTLIYTEDDTATAEVDALEGMISEFSGSADTVVNVYRQGDGKSLSFLFRTHPGEMTGGEIMEQCRDHYGTGSYRVHIRQGPRLVANKPFSVEAKKEPEEDERYRRDDNGREMLAFITAQMNNQQAMFANTMTAFAEVFKGNQQNTQPPFDPVAMQTSLIQSLAALKQMSEGKDESKSAIEMFIQGITLAKDLAPKDGETNTSDLLLKGLEMFGPTISEATKQAAMRRTNSEQVPPGNGQQNLQAPNADAEREREMGLQKMMLKQQLGFLIAQAKSGKDPELYAELLLDQVGEERVLQFIGQPDAMKKLIELNPEVSTVQVWFDRLRYAILDLTNDDDAGETESTEGAPVSGEVVSKAETDALSESTNAGNTGGNSERPTGDTGDS